MPSKSYLFWPTILYTFCPLIVVIAVVTSILMVRNHGTYIIARNSEKDQRLCYVNRIFIAIGAVKFQWQSCRERFYWIAHTCHCNKILSVLVASLNSIFGGLFPYSRHKHRVFFIPLIRLEQILKLSKRITDQDQSHSNIGIVSTTNSIQNTNILNRSGKKASKSWAHWFHLHFYSYTQCCQTVTCDVAHYVRSVFVCIKQWQANVFEIFGPCIWI